MNKLPIFNRNENQFGYESPKPFAGYPSNPDDKLGSDKTSEHEPTDSIRNYHIETSELMNKVPNFNKNELCVRSLQGH